MTTPRYTSHYDTATPLRQKWHYDTATVHTLGRQRAICDIIMTAINTCAPQTVTALTRRVQGKMDAARQEVECAVDQLIKENHIKRGEVL